MTTLTAITSGEIFVQMSAGDQGGTYAPIITPLSEAECNSVIRSEWKLCDFGVRQKDALSSVESHERTRKTGVKATSNALRARLKMIGFYLPQDFVVNRNKDRRQ
jgi:hypothetical protein